MVLAALQPLQAASQPSMAQALSDPTADANAGRKQRLLAQMLMQGAQQTRPNSALSGLAQGLQRGLGIRALRKADDADEARRQGMAKLLKQDERFANVPLELMNEKQMGQLVMQQYDPSIQLRRDAMEQEADLAKQRIGLQRQGLDLDRAGLDLRRQGLEFDQNYKNQQLGLDTRLADLNERKINNQISDSEFEREQARLTAQRKREQDEIANQFLQQYLGMQNPLPQSTPPQQGEVMDGYRFLGGDPSDQANWQEMQ